MATTTPPEVRAGVGQSTLERYTGLDATRGVAVMGILAMNIYAFAMPGGTYFNPAAYGGDSGIDLAAWFFNFVFVDSKMRGLFSVLFGASTLLVIERATASERSAAGAHYSRMLWLAVFGLIHFYAIWWGDILFLYASCGVLLFLFRNASIKALIGWAFGFLLISMLFMVGSYAMFSLYQSGALSPDASAGLAEALREMDGQLGTSQVQVAKDLALYRGDYAAIFSHRTGPMLAYPLMGVFQFLWETMALMLIGMALFKSRMLTGEWDATRYRKWALVCFVIAVPPLVWLAFYQMQAEFDVVAVFGSTLALSAPFDIVMTVGWAALIMLVVKRLRGGAIVERLAATGRMAFTNYLATSIVMTTIFYGYGFGLYGDIGRAGLYLFVFGMWAAMLLWSKPWLARFHYGPLEWLWRSLSRWSVQPMSKSPIANH